MLSQLVRVGLAVRTMTYRPAESSEYFRNADTMAKSSHLSAGHFCLAWKSISESQANGISLQF